MRNQILSVDRRRSIKPPARPSEQSQDGRRAHAGFAHRLQSCVAMAFGQPSAVRPDDQRQMNEVWRPQSKGSIKKELSRRGRDQIIAPNDMSDLFIRIVNNHGQLIAWRIGRLPNNKVATIAPKINGDAAAIKIVEPRRLVHAEPPRIPIIRRQVERSPASAGSGVGCFNPVSVGSACRAINVATSASARVNKLGGSQLFECDFIGRQTSRLHDDFTIPIEPKPTKVFNGALRGIAFDAGRINILDSQYDAAAGCAGEKPGGQIRARVA